MLSQIKGKNFGVKIPGAYELENLNENKFKVQRDKFQNLTADEMSNVFEMPDFGFDTSSFDIDKNEYRPRPAGGSRNSKIYEKLSKSQIVILHL